MSDQLRFDGRVAVVTGAGNGLGRAHAMLLASRGAQVVVNDIGASVSGAGTDDAPAEAVAAEIRAAGGVAVADTHSVATADGGEQLVGTALEAFGRIDVLVNNAGIVRSVPFEDTDPTVLDPVLDVHLHGAFHVTRPAWRAMAAQGGGRIVNTTSSAGLLGNAGMSAYGAAKGGVYGLTRVLAIEGMKHGIRVNAIAPTAATRMLAEAMGTATEVSDPAQLAAIQAAVAALRPDLVAEVVAYLAHDSCSVTGEVFTTGGGEVSRFALVRTTGWFSPTLTAEDVRTHLDEIRDTSSFTVPADVGDESAALIGLIAAHLS